MAISNHVLVLILVFLFAAIPAAANAACATLYNPKGDTSMDQQRDFWAGWTVNIVDLDIVWPSSTKSIVFWRATRENGPWKKLRAYEDKEGWSLADSARAGMVDQPPDTRHTYYYKASAFDARHKLIKKYDCLYLPPPHNTDE